MCLVSFKPLPEKLHEMNELSEAEWSCMQRSGIQRNTAEGSERMKFALMYYFFGMLCLVALMHMVVSIFYQYRNRIELGICNRANNYNLYKHFKKI